MALNSMRIPLSQVAKRGLAAQAAVHPVESQQSPETNCTVLPNKLMLCSTDLGGPLSRVSVVFKVGSRHETHRNLGAVHVIRSLAGFGTDKCTGFAIWKNTQHNGTHVYCTGDREVTSFHLIGARHKINDSLKFFSAMVGSPAFKPWEVKDNAPRLHYELNGLTPQVKVMDSLHAAAFRTGLGNSLFIPPDRIGTITSPMLQAFYRDGFTANRATVVGYNVCPGDIQEFAKSLDLSANELPEGNSTYYGGEIRQQVSSYFAHIAIATQSAGMRDLKEALVFSVLQYAYGVRPAVAWGGTPSPLYKATYPVAPDAGVSCLNCSYSDTGLFGVFISSSAETAGKALKEAFKVLKSGTVSDADFRRAKALVKGNMLYDCEVSENIVEDMGVQSLQGGVVIPGSVLSEAIDKITLADVNQAAKKIASGKFSLAAYGDLYEVPYLDELS